MEIIVFLKMAEDVTGLPAIMQGQIGKAPDTVRHDAVVQQRVVGAATYARLFDDRLTTPYIRRYYDWLMQYSDNPGEKRDDQIKATGSGTG